VTICHTKVQSNWSSSRAKTRVTLAVEPGLLFPFSEGFDLALGTSSMSSSETTNPSSESSLSVEARFDNDFVFLDAPPFVLASVISSSSEITSASESERRLDKVPGLDSASERAVSASLEIADIDEVRVRLGSRPLGYCKKIEWGVVHALFPPLVEGGFLNPTSLSAKDTVAGAAASSPEESSSINSLRLFRVY
jgi:hypothetical protein